jgi:hypothetical protein
MKRARSAVKPAGAAAVELTGKIETTVGISRSGRRTGHTFGIPCSAVMACDDEAIRQSRSR